MRLSFRKLGFIGFGFLLLFLGCSKSPQQSDLLGSTVQASSEPQVGNLTLSQITGGYPVEVAPEGRLNWVKDTITYEYAVPESSDFTAFGLEAEIISIVPNLRFTIIDRQGSAAGQRTVELPESHQAWTQAAMVKVSIPRVPHSNKLLLEFTTPIKPTIITGDDKREATFLIRNLRVTLHRHLAP